MRIQKCNLLRPNFFSAAFLIGGIALFDQAAISQTLGQCVRDLVSAGVSPNVAAEKCTVGGVSASSSSEAMLDRYEKCIEKNQYLVIKGIPRQRADGKTEYEYPSLDDSAGQSAWKKAGANCWDTGFFNFKVICWDSEIKRSIRSSESAAEVCRPLLPTDSKSGNGTIIINQSGQ